MDSTTAVFPLGWHKLSAYLFKILRSSKALRSTATCPSLLESVMTLLYEPHVDYKLNSSYTIYSLYILNFQTFLRMSAMKFPTCDNRHDGAS